jgi:ABC-type sulfate/molybdate transport systems ATPase subunit
VNEEVAVLEFSLQSKRGNFKLQMISIFHAPWTVLFGPSGSGKTSLLRLVAGLEPIKSAHILLNGYSLINIPFKQKHIGYVAQQPALFPHLNVFSNVAFGITKLSRSIRTARVESMLELAGALTLINRHVQDLSGGEQQRVALARALAPAPHLLLLDEPFSAIDGLSSDALLMRLRKWTTENNVQTILATHDATDALLIEAEVALLNEGKIIAQGPALSVLATERERILARLKN